MDQGLARDVARRRTFAIISHPDAGKTTLTEKLLLAGGAIHQAGEVRARGDRRRARSDWMAIEQKRGISVTSSVMTFEHGDHVFNLLDTPGHEDFSEDTYRTLTAVDSAVMVIDAARGIEPQTLKLFEVCRLRSVPVLTFINKVDREGRHPFDLLDEIADRLALDVAPLNWPLGMGSAFAGLAALDGEGLETPDGHGKHAAAALDALAEERALALAGYPRFDETAYRAGDLTGVMFGSALRNLGVAALLGKLAAHAPSPRPQPAEPVAIDPLDETVTGFVFKVQANMDPQHRDRVAFVRLASGRFRRGMRLATSRGQSLAVHSPMFFLARERERAEEAVAGDVLGIPNHGTLAVGDSLSSGTPVRITGLPDFAPELLRRVAPDDPSRVKQLRKALDDLAEEGVVQTFRPEVGGPVVVGAVGPLQLDVLAARLAGEYRVGVAIEPAPFEAARWLAADAPDELEAFARLHRSQLALDREDRLVFLARDRFELSYLAERFPKLRFLSTRERG